MARQTPMTARTIPDGTTKPNSSSSRSLLAPSEKASAGSSKP